MLEPGRIVDRYEVVDLLGEGGMAAVYRVRHTALGSEHALKVLTTTSPGITERLLAEGRVQAGIDHPHALTVTDVIEVDGAPGLIMELIRNGTLDEWIAAEPPRQERLRVFRQITSAVAVAHAHGWVHRDLKPGNVLMKGEGASALPKVADFGLVKAVAGAPRPDKATRDGVAMGTPGYMAPEQISNAAAVDVQADVYSLGCLLVFMLTGEPAFEGDVLEVFAKVAASEHRSLPTGDPLYDLVEHCLEAEPDARPASAGALRDALDAALAAPGEPPRVPAASTAQKGPPVPPLAMFAGLGFVVLAAGCLCGAGVFSTLLSTSSPSTSENADLVGSCPSTAARRRIGYALVPRVNLRLDDVYELSEAADVIPNPRTRDVVACRLPAGTRLQMREVPRSPRSEPDKTWLPVFEDALEPP